MKEALHSIDEWYEETVLFLQRLHQVKAGQVTYSFESIKKETYAYDKRMDSRYASIEHWWSSTSHTLHETQLENAKEASDKLIVQSFFERTREALFVRSLQSLQYTLKRIEREVYQTLEKIEGNKLENETSSIKK